MELKEHLEAAYRTAVHFVNPHDLVQERLRKIPSSGRLFVLGAGKAAAPMAQCIEEFFVDRIEQGLIVVKDGYGLPLKKIKVLEAGHPIPDRRSVEASKQAMALAQRAGPEDVVIALISGGTSSLWLLPRSGDAAAAIKRTQELLKSGLSIQEINQKRRELNAISAGGLARAAAPAKVVALILSDVMGNDLSTIGSGPTVVDPPEPSRVQNILIGDNALAVGGAAHGARRFGYSVESLFASIVGDAAEEGRSFARKLLSMDAGTALVGGGETTVKLGVQHGKGGRCQEMALAAAIEIKDKPGVALLFAGTDGSDGPTDAAGAFVDGNTVVRASKMGMNAQDLLQRHDSYTFFEKLGDLFKPGPTRTNVADVAVGLKKF